MVSCVESLDLDINLWSFSSVYSSNTKAWYSGNIRACQPACTDNKRKHRQRRRPTALLILLAACGRDGGDGERETTFSGRNAFRDFAFACVEDDRPSLANAWLSRRRVCLCLAQENRKKGCRAGRSCDRYPQTLKVPTSQDAMQAGSARAQQTVCSTAVNHCISCPASTRPGIERRAITMQMLMTPWHEAGGHQRDVMIFRIIMPRPGAVVEH